MHDDSGRSDLPILHPDIAGEDNPTSFERALVHPPVPYWAAAAIVAGALGLGASLLWAVPLSVMGLVAPRVWAAVAFSRNFQAGNYRRALFLASRLVRSSRRRRDRMVWMLNEATCHIVLGNLERGREIASAIDTDELPSYATWVLKVNTAALHVLAGDAESAISVLDGLDEESLPRTAKPLLYVNRAAALSLRGDYSRALRDIERLESPPRARAWTLRVLGLERVLGPEFKPTNRILAAAYSIKALIKSEKEGDIAGAVELSRRAVELVGDDWRVHPQVAVTHARLTLEAVKDERACLEMLARVADYELEMGLVTRAEYYYVMARCYHACGLVPEARSFLRRLTDLPSPPHLRMRVIAFIDELQKKNLE